MSATDPPPDPARQLAAAERALAAERARADAAEQTAARAQERVEQARRTLTDAGMRAFQAAAAGRAEQATLMAALAEHRCRSAAARHDIEQLQARLAAAERALSEAGAERDALLGSTLWRATWPVRQLGARLPPQAKRQGARLARLLWWSATLQLPQRLRDRTAAGAIAGAIEPSLPAPSPPEPLAPDPIPHPPPAAVPPCLHGVATPVAMAIAPTWRRGPEGGDAEILALTDALVQFGYRVIVAAWPMEPGTAAQGEALQAGDVFRLGPEDAPSVQAFIQRHGDAIDLFVPVRLDADEAVLQLVRSHAPRASVLVFGLPPRHDDGMTRVPESADTAFFDGEPSPPAPDSFRGRLHEALIGLGLPVLTPASDRDAGSTPASSA